MTETISIPIPLLRERRKVVSICLAAMVLPITFAGGAIATPDLGRDFGQNGPILFWVVNAFMMVFGALPLVAGALADRIGRRKVFRFGLVGFIFSGVLLAMSPTLLVVDLLRGLQGLFAAATLAGGTAVLAQMPGEKERRQAFSMIGATFGFGLAFGPVIAGFAIEVGGWRSVFMFTSLLALLSLAIGAGAIPESKSPEDRPFDKVGATLFSGGLIAFTIWAVMAPTTKFTDPIELGLILLALVCLAAFLRWEKRHAAPMFDPTLLKSPVFLGIQALPIATCFGFVSLLVVVPLQLMGAGYSELEAGLISMALSVPVFLVSALLAQFPLGDRRTLIVLGLAIAAIGLVWLAFVSFNGAVTPLVLPLSLIGAGIGFPWGLMDGLAIEVVPREKAGVATGMFSTVRVASEGLVLALVSAVYSWLIARNAGVSDQTAAAIVSGGAIPPTIQQQVDAASRTLFLSLGILTVLAAIFTWSRLRHHPRQ